MEMEEIQTHQLCKFPRVINGNGRNNKVGQYPDEEEDGAAATATARNGRIGRDNVDAGNEISFARLRGWHHSSRIFRVSRASGGKDRHSKVLTSKGLRDRRVRLSVSTAIQFYDLQDRLGYDQPSKAVEWLIKAAADSIAELPSLNSSFPNTPEKGTEQLLDDPNYHLHHQQQQHQYHQQQQQPHLSVSKSACSSTSETSKGSGLTLSKSDARVNNRVKARERARERSAAKEKKENGYANPISETSSFTQLLTGCVNNSSNNNNNNGSDTTTHSSQANPIFAHSKSAPMDYFNPARALTQHSSLFSSQIQMGISMQPHSMSIPPPFSLSIENNTNNHSNFQELQHFSLVPESLMPTTTNGNEYNLNFTISSASSPGLTGFNDRGTLQSNSSPPQPSSLFPHNHLQRFSSIEGSNVPFYMDNNNNHHHHFPAGLDGRLHLYYGDHSDHKGKGKN